MKNSIKLLLLSVITPLLCIGVSFGATIGFSDYQYLLDIIDGGNLDSSNSSFIVPYDRPFCVSFYNGYGGGNHYSSNFDFRACGVDQSNNEQCGLPLSQPIYLSVGEDSRLYCFDPSFWSIDMNGFTMTRLTLGGYFGNYALSYVDYNLYTIDSYAGPVCPPCEDCSSISSALSKCESTVSKLESDYDSLSGNYNTCLNRVNTLNGEIGTLSGNLASCNSDLNSCLSNGSNCDTLYGVCVENLSGCNSDKASLQIYNESLSSQLNECLSSSGSIGSGSIFTFDFDIFRSDEGQDYSLPITNNLFLPNGYKAMLNSDHVLTIAKANSLNHAYSISDDDFSNKVISSYGTIFIFLMSLSFMLLFMFTIRKYFIGLKSVK